MAGQRFIELSAIAVVALMGVVSGAFAEGRVSVEVPAQSLKDALDQFGQQTRTNFLIADMAFVASRRSAAVHGVVTREQGLTQLLKGTGVTYSFVNANTMVVRRERRAVASIRRVATVPAATEAAELEEVTVMGTQLQGFKPEAAPVSFYPRIEIERSGQGSLAAFSNSLIENFPLITAETFLNNGRQVQALFNQGRGNAYSFFGLPTLTLLDGQRLPAAGSTGSFVDVSGIPLSAIEGIAVLTGDVSAIYGSDAVGGAANISLRDDLSGAETVVRYGQTSRGGGSQRAVTQLLGGSWGRGRAMGVLEYDHELPVEAGQRPSVPEQVGTFLLVPEQRRRSAIATLRQDLTDQTRLSANLVYADRSFSQTSASVLQTLSRKFETYAAGEVEQLHGTFSLSRTFQENWRATLFGNYGLQIEDITNVSNEIGSAATFDAVFSTESSIASADLHLQSPDFSVLKREIKGMIGIAARQETFDNHSQLANVGTGLRRDVYSLFSELSVPLMERAGNELPIQRLDLSAAARFDRYRGATPKTQVDSFDPRVGLVWSPYNGLRLRATWGTSFSAPTLTHTSEMHNSAVQTPLIDPNSPSGTSVGLVLSGGNESLKPERSKSHTLGVDWTPTITPGLQLSATYSSIDFTDQIGRPLQSTSPIEALGRFATAEPFITVSPSASTVHELYSRYSVTDLTNTGESGVAVILDNRFTNLSSVKVEGLEFSGLYSLDPGRSRVTFDLRASYIFGVHYKASSSADTVDLVDTEFNPVDFRGWARVLWEQGAVGASLRANYVDSYRSSLAEMPQKVSAWFTADAQIAYRRGETGLSLSFNIQNLTDKLPPWVGTSMLGYDPTHASILGRTISLQVRQRW